MSDAEVFKVKNRLAQHVIEPGGMTAGMANTRAARELAALSQRTTEVRLGTSIIVLPLHNPLQSAEDVATLDQICNGRFTLGAGIGYRETELEAAGATRKERAPRLAAWR